MAATDPLPQRTRFWAVVALLGASLFVQVASTLPASAQSRVAARTSLFHERRGPLHSTAITPAVDGTAELGDVVLNAGWEADIVSSATIALVDSPANVDAISSATQMSDVRHTFRVGSTFTLGDVRLRAGYSYGFERDYRSHGISLGAAVDLRSRTTTLDVGYGLSVDQVCDADNQGLSPLDRARMSNADGCYSGRRQRDTRSALDNAFTLTWTQVLRRDLVAQTTLSLGVAHGFLSSPYREVWQGLFGAQEYHPDRRRRGALATELRFSLDALNAVLGVRVGGAHDEWGVSSAAGAVTWRQKLPANFRLRLHLRAYRQTGAFFYSDDYVSQPRGQYFTGDRELSPLSSWLAGTRLQWAPRPSGEAWLGFLEGIRIAVDFTISQARYHDFSYGNVPMPDGYWLVSTLLLESAF